MANFLLLSFSNNNQYILKHNFFKWRKLSHSRFRGILFMFLFFFLFFFFFSASIFLSNLKFSQIASTNSCLRYNHLQICWVTLGRLKSINHKPRRSYSPKDYISCIADRTERKELETEHFYVQLCCLYLYSNFFWKFCQLVPVLVLLFKKIWKIK